MTTTTLNELHGLSISPRGIVQCFLPASRLQPGDPVGLPDRWIEDLGRVLVKADVLTVRLGADDVEVTAQPREDGAQPRTVTFPANQLVSMPSTLAPIVEKVIANTRYARHARARRR